MTIKRLPTKFEQEVMNENSRLNRWARLIMKAAIFILFIMVAAKYISGAW